MGLEFKDYYTVLGLKKNAAPAEVKQAYRRLAKEHHPDLHSAKDKARAEGMFKEINEAYEVLSVPEKREKYDRLGPDWEKAGPVPPPDFRQPPSRPRAGPKEEPFAGFSDFFETYFAQADGQSSGQGRTAPSGPRKGQDVEAELPLSLEDSLLGGEKRLTILAPMLCPSCAGSGRQGAGFCPTCAGLGEARQERSVVSRLPKNILDGMRLRLRGQGGTSASGAEPGDLFLIVRFLPHPAYKVSGSDIETTVTAMPWDASLGGELPVASLEGPLRIRIPAGTHAGRRLRIAGRGLGKEDGSRGDLYAVVRIDIPDRTDARIERLFRGLKEAGP